MRLSGHQLFFRSVARDFRRTGAVAPSSRFLGYAMTSELARRGPVPATVLEVGGGSGSITEVIARRMFPGGRLDVYEIDSALAGVLRRRFTGEAATRFAHLDIRIYNSPIESIEPQPVYDFIVSCLPFTNFHPDAVGRIFEIYRTLLGPRGVCTYYEYILVRRLALMVSGGPHERLRVVGVGDVVRRYTEPFCFKREVVLCNIPPAGVYHLRFG
jgi:phosphatidylethanolamine/phosphatidyl-N-methylethanolamine N-methyltransferase